MKYVSIDIETTGLDPNYCLAIELAAVVEDTDQKTPVDDLPQRHYLIVPSSGALMVGEPFALSMHAERFKLIDKHKNITAPEWISAGEGRPILAMPQSSLLHDLARFIESEGAVFQGKFTAAGKNFGAFDLQFIKRMPCFEDLPRLHHRILDPAVLFLDKMDMAPPDLKTCLNRAGIEKTVAHNALDDARDVVRVLRAGLYGRLHSDLFTGIKP